ncbi:MAG: 1-acyl-sn-glycerol-3-phosphate acyltransferase [Chitinophagales bacterium]|nr:1-acyl-sn-glycerol-3-phosphate acyltransferase [Chitinophagales bacterium]MDW8418952.1 lysophospholipid acyltransferase family protein [Chitinophagales bacterium]
MRLIWFNFRYASPFLCSLLLLKVKVHGAERINPLQPYVFVANHNAQIDIICGASATPQPARFLAKVEVKRIPFFGYMARMFTILVDRKNKESRERSYRHMVEALQRGESIFIYPEGTRNRTDELLKEFKDGAFKVAIMAQVPIAVQTLRNTRKLNDPRSLYLCPGTVEVYWSEPIPTAGMTMNDLPLLKERVRQEMLAHLQQ